MYYDPPAPERPSLCIISRKCAVAGDSTSEVGKGRRVFNSAPFNLAGKARRAPRPAICLQEGYSSMFYPSPPAGTNSNTGPEQTPHHRILRRITAICGLFRNNGRPSPLAPACTGTRAPAKHSLDSLCLRPSWECTLTSAFQIPRSPAFHLWAKDPLALNNTYVALNCIHCIALLYITLVLTPIVSTTGQNVSNLALDNRAFVISRERECNKAGHRWETSKCNIHLEILKDQMKT